MDTRFPYINLILKAFFDNVNGTILKAVVMRALSFRGRIDKTTVVLLDSTHLPRAAILKTSKRVQIGFRAMHEGC